MKIPVLLRRLAIVTACAVTVLCALHAWAADPPPKRAPVKKPAGERTAFDAPKRSASAAARLEFPIVGVRPGTEIQCGDACLCKGAGDCVNLVYSGCCSGSITCDDSGCSCVNGGGCDADGHK